ncbi:MAG TPA: Holliday junction branch migration protein RuvA [Myxococcaceae bacterium]|nr:Holliday junction branch migration protein RuvA [Myxococcaceae bacterium]
MIAALRGVVLEKNQSEAILDSNGVGYRVHFSLLTAARLPDEGQPVKVRIRTVVREDALELFGFLSRAEEEMFLLLTSVSNVGPRLAMTVLSGLAVSDLASAISRVEVGRLTQIHGVGKKTAERLVVELKDKVKMIQLEARMEGREEPVQGTRDDVVSALVNLGYKGSQAEKAADLAAQRMGAEAAFEALFREALKGLRSGA